MAKLGVNIDHVATLRNARGGTLPCPIQAALISETAGADGITAHLREDRRHIKDADIAALKSQILTRLNLEMANTAEMVAIALKTQPYMVTLVPERREELTTEGGLDVVRYLESITTASKTLQDANILVSLFIDPSPEQVQASFNSGAKVIELHTGRYCEAFTEEGKLGVKAQQELEALNKAAELAVQLGLEVNAGHGLNTENVQPVLTLAGLNELNIGHSIIAEAVFTGLAPAVAKMKALIS